MVFAVRWPVEQVNFRRQMNVVQCTHTAGRRTRTRTPYRVACQHDRPLTRHGVPNEVNFTLAPHEVRSLVRVVRRVGFKNRQHAEHLCVRAHNRAAIVITSWIGVRPQAHTSTHCHIQSSN